MRHVLAALVLGLAACQPAGGLDEIKSSQKEILDKLGNIEQRVDQMAKQVAAARGPQRPPTEDFNKVYQIDIGAAPVMGDPEAPVALVEFSDFQCPFCARTEPLLQQVLEKNKGKVKIVYKHFPLQMHPAARPAAIASLAAQEQGKFWEFHGVLFKNYATLNPESFEKYAQEAGLDVQRFKQDLEKNGEAYAKQVDADYAQGLKVDVQGTPAFYIGGKKVSERSLEGMTRMIEEAAKQG